MQWRKREFNKEADYLANYAMNTKCDLDFVSNTLLAKRSAITNLQGWSDGGCRVAEGISSYGWILKVWLGEDGPYIIAAGARYFDHPSASSTCIEAEGALELWEFVLKLLRGDTLANRSHAKNNIIPGGRKRPRCIEGLLQQSYSTSHSTVF